MSDATCRVDTAKPPLRWYKPCGKPMPCEDHNAVTREQALESVLEEMMDADWVAELHAVAKAEGVIARTSLEQLSVFSRYIRKRVRQTTREALRHATPTPAKEDGDG